MADYCSATLSAPDALWETQVRGVTQPESANKQPQIMSVIRTIEFVDPVAAQGDSVSDGE